MPIVENYPGVNLEDFRIRITDQHSEISAAINLVILDNGEKREQNINRTPYPTDADLREVLENCKKYIAGVTILKRIDPNTEADLFA